MRVWEGRREGPEGRADGNREKQRGSGRPRRAPPGPSRVLARQLTPRRLLPPTSRPPLPPTRTPFLFPPRTPLAGTAVLNSPPTPRRRCHPSCLKAVPGPRESLSAASSCPHPAARPGAPPADATMAAAWRAVDSGSLPPPCLPVSPSHPVSCLPRAAAGAEPQPQPALHLGIPADSQSINQGV